MEAAIEYDWPEECRYSGAHCSRHGAAQDAYEEGGLDLVMLRTGHLSAKSTAYYALLDARRVHNATYRKSSIEEKRVLLITLQKNSREKAEKAITSGLRLQQFYTPKLVEQVVGGKRPFTGDHRTTTIATKKEMKEDQVQKVSSNITSVGGQDDSGKRLRRRLGSDYTRRLQERKKMSTKD